MSYWSSREYDSMYDYAEPDKPEEDIECPMCGADMLLTVEGTQFCCVCEYEEE